VAGTRRRSKSGRLIDRLFEGRLIEGRNVGARRSASAHVGQRRRRATSFDPIY